MSCRIIQYNIHLILVILSLFGFLSGNMGEKVSFLMFSITFLFHKDRMVTKVLDRCYKLFLSVSPSFYADFVIVTLTLPVL